MISFDYNVDYKPSALVKTQRLSLIPKIPQLEGMRIPSPDVNAHKMTLGQSIDMDEKDNPLDPYQATFLDAEKVNKKTKRAEHENPYDHMMLFRERESTTDRKRCYLGRQTQERRSNPGWKRPHCGNAWNYVGQWQPYMTNHQICFFGEQRRKKQHKSKRKCKTSAICFLFACVLLFSWYHFCTYENFYLSAIFAVRS